MFNCPECSNEMGWVGDNEIADEVYVTTMMCRDCHIEVSKFWGDRVEEEF